MAAASGRVGGGGVGARKGMTEQLAMEFAEQEPDPAAMVAVRFAGYRPLDHTGPDPETGRGYTGAEQERRAEERAAGLGHRLGGWHVGPSMLERFARCHRRGCGCLALFHWMHGFNLLASVDNALVRPCGGEQSP